MGNRNRALRMVVIGSSTAEGIGASNTRYAWVSLYRTLLHQLNPQHDIVNLGLGGLSSYQLLPTEHGATPARPLPDPQHNITRALQFKPDAVLVNLPSNDTVSGHSVVEQVANLHKIVDYARKRHVGVWVLSTQPRNLPDGLVTVQKAVRERILQAFHPMAIDVWTPLADANGLLNARFDSGDGTHINDAGHEAVFRAVADANIPDALVHKPRSGNCVRRLFRRWASFFGL